MDRSDKLYARAKTVAERERQRLELEALESGDSNAIHQQSDSELLVLASSLFDGIKGIRSGTGRRRILSGKVVKYRDD